MEEEGAEYRQTNEIGETENGAWGESQRQEKDGKEIGNGTGRAP